MDEVFGDLGPAGRPVAAVKPPKKRPPPTKVYSHASVPLEQRPIKPLVVAPDRKAEALAHRQTLAKRRKTLAQKKFLAEYRTRGIIRLACEAAGVSRSAVGQWQQEDPVFLMDMKVCEKDAADRLEAEAIRRGVDGWDEPVFQTGKQVGVVRKYSDHCLLTTLKARKPNEYREQRETRLTGPGGGPIQIATMAIERLTDEELEVLDRLHARAALPARAS